MSEYIAKCIEVIGISGKPIKVPDYIDMDTEIVRCKDCSLQDEFGYCDRLGFKVGDDGFCAWPIRKRY